MFPSDQPLDELLEMALSITDRAKRDDWLHHICGGDQEKLDELRSLILASEKTQWIDTPLHIVSQGLQSSTELPSDQVGPFKLLRRIGKGGMGEVFLAQQQKPVRRLVAIKMIQQDIESTQILQRFQSEQQTLANMEHPNIARIIDAGITESGTHYIAMEYVHGEQLLEYSHSKDLGVKAKIELMLQCCLGIQHAHKKGTIHRDIKPNNILVTLVDGDPLVKVIDFGIAKALASCASHEELSEVGIVPDRIASKGTATGISPGTPRFMSPEQYRSNQSQIDTRSDIYSLGAVLYTLLVDNPPFDDLSLENLSLDQIKEQITNKDPIAPSKRLPEYARVLTGALDAIVLKSMQRDPEDRYQTVGELMEDLRCYLNDLPVKAHPESTWKKAKRFSKRHRILLGSTFLAIAGLLGGLIMSIAQERRAIESEKQAKRQSYSSDLLLASMAISKRNYTLAQEMLDRHRTDSDAYTHSQGRLDWRLLSSQIPQEPTTLAQFPDKIYYGLSLPERREVVSGGRNSHLRFVEVSTSKIRLDIDTEQKEINGLARSPDGKTIATGGDDGKVKFWDIETGANVGEFQASNSSVYQIGWTHDGRRFITAGSTPNASVWSVPEFKLEQFLDSSNEALECLSVGSQGQVAYGSDKGVIRIANLTDQGNSHIQNLSAFNSRAFDVNRCSTVVFSSSGKMLAVGLNSGYLILLQQRDAKYHVVERIRFSTTVTAVDFSFDESKIAIGEDNGSVHVLSLPKDWPTQSRLRFTKYFLDENRSAYPDLDPLDTDSLWKMVSKTEPADLDKNLPLELDRVFLEFNQPMKNVVFSDNFIREWTDQAGNTRPEWKEIPKAVVFRAEGVELQFENRYRGWSELSQLVSQGRLSSWNVHSRRVASIQWNEDQNLLMSFSEDGSIRTVKTDLSDSMSIGGDDVKSFSLLQGSKLAVLKADDRAYIITLDPNRMEPRSNVSFPEGSAATFGYTYENENQLIFPFVDRQKSTSPFQIYHWDIKTQAATKITHFPSDLKFRYLVGKLQGNRLAILAEKQSAHLTNEKQLLCLASWDLNLQKTNWETNPRQDEYRLPTVSTLGRFVAFVQERLIRIVDTNDGTERGLGDFSGLDILSIRFSPDEKFLVAAISDNTLVCYRTSDAQRIWEVRTAGSPVSDLDWSKDSEILVCVSRDGFLKTLDTVLLQMSTEVPLQLKNPVAVKIAPEEDWIYVLGRDGTLIRIPCGRSREEMLVQKHLP